MRYYYAQINEDGYVTAILDTYAPMSEPHMIQIPSYDESYYNKRYVDGIWYTL